MRTRLALSVFTAVAILLLNANPAGATIAFSQQVVLKNDPTASVGYARTYHSFSDGAQDCTVPIGSIQCQYPTGHGSLHIIPRTYRLVEGNHTYDYYLIDLTVTNRNVVGSKGMGYLDARIKSASAVRAATFSLGKSTVDDCKRYPIEIDAGWGPISAGTTVGTFGVNCYDTSITRVAITSGQRYHVTNIGAVNTVTFQRFVVVPAGTRPSFSYWVSWPTDRCFNNYTPVGGSSMAWYRSCVNSSASLSHTIGTTG